MDTASGGLLVDRDPTELSGNLDLALDRMLTLLRDEGDYDARFLKPNGEALGAAASALFQIASLLGGDLPRTVPTPDGEGGIRLRWRRDDREVAVDFPAHAPHRPVLYHEAGDEYGGEEHVSVRQIVDWLHWLQRA